MSDDAIPANLTKHEEEAIDPAIPWEADRLDRQAVAETLGRVLLTIEQPFVVAINSPFGTGKSFFVKRLIQDFKNQNQIALYFNAWEKDNHGQPLLSVVGELQRQLGEYGITKKRASMSKVAKEAGLLVARKTIPALVRIGTAGWVGDDMLEKLGQAGEEAINGAGSMAEGLVQQQVVTETAFEDFRADLTKLATDAIDKVGEPAKAIYVFIDELDRCRPPYALELLENIKHLFSVPGMVFVLSIDRDHLKNSISTIYGSGMDSEGYLARFIDQSYNLPPTNPKAYVEYLSHRFGLDKVAMHRRDGVGELEAILQSFSTLAAIFNLSLRHQEQAFGEINFVLRNKKPNQTTSAPLIGALAILKRVDQDIYESYCHGRIEFSHVEDLIRAQPNGDAWLRDRNSLAIRAWLKVGPIHEIRELDVEQRPLIDRLNEINNSGTSTPEDVAERSDLEGKIKLISEAIDVAAMLTRYGLMDGILTSTPALIVHGDFGLAAQYTP